MEEETSDGGIFADSNSHATEAVPEFDSQEMIANAGSQKKGKRTTVCVADSDGNPLVARAEYDESGQLGLLENYRRPTQEEWSKLQTKGQIVKQGQVGATTTPTGVGGGGGGGGAGTGIPKFAKIGAAVLGVGALAVGGIYLYNKSRNSNPSYDGGGLDDPDDGDDDDDDDDGDED